MRAHRLGSNGLAQRTNPLTAEARLTRTTLATALLVALGIAVPVHAATFTVRSAADSGPGTLRQAVLDANATGGGHSGGHQNIKFALPAGGTITLTRCLIALTGCRPGIEGADDQRQSPVADFRMRRGWQLTLSATTLDDLARDDATNFYDEVGGAIRVGALPAPAIAAEFSASLDAARHEAQAEAIRDNAPRAARRASLRALRSLQSRQQPSLPAAQSLILDCFASIMSPCSTIGPMRRTCPFLSVCSFQVAPTA